MLCVILVLYSFVVVFSSFFSFISSCWRFSIRNITFEPSAPKAKPLKTPLRRKLRSWIPWCNRLRIQQLMTSYLRMKSQVFGLRYDLNLLKEQESRNDVTMTAVPISNDNQLLGTVVDHLQMVVSSSSVLNQSHH